MTTLTIEIMEQVRSIALGNAEAALDQRDDVRNYPTHAACYCAHATNVIDSLHDERIDIRAIPLAMRCYWSRIDAAVQAEEKAAAERPSDDEIAIDLGRSNAIAAHDARLATDRPLKAYRQNVIDGCAAERLSAKATKLALAVFTRTCREIKAERKAAKAEVV